MKYYTIFRNGKEVSDKLRLPELFENEIEFSPYLPWILFCMRHIKSGGIIKNGIEEFVKDAVNLGYSVELIEV